MYPNSLQQLIESFKYLPGVGEKTAERIAFAIMDMDDEQVEFFSSCLSNIKNKIHKCPICNGITDLDVCPICNDKSRGDDTLCVVEDPKSVFLFEKLGLYKGKYHVLNGLISPLDGIGPEQINLASLVQRVVNCNVKEIILAIKPNIEGDTTMYYIKKLLDSFDVKVTKIAAGIPVGTEIEYLDTITLKLAIDGRKDI